MTKIDLLDKGYVQLIEHWGSDQSIIEAARMSTNKGFNGWGTGEHPGDEKLLRYLFVNKHHTPFEMGGLTIEVKAPIFVFREWHRHRTFSYNEMSARYTPLPDQNYMPAFERLFANGGQNKQAQGIGGTLSQADATDWLSKLGECYRICQETYDYALRAGVPKELARLSVPVARYSRMRASGNLRNWLGFLKLRLDTAAQYEIRVYAEAVGDIIAAHFPRTWELFSSEDVK